MDWAAAWAALKELWPTIKQAIIVWLAAMNQKKLDEGSAAKGTLDAVKRADEAAAPVDGMSDADILRDLRKRGRLRNLP
jgi:hypothetical protein